MQILEIMSSSDSFTDENVSQYDAIGYINQAIGRINAEGFSFPLLKATDIEYTAFSDSWQALLLVVYVCYGVKMKETDLQEADRYLAIFESYLAKFVTKAGSIVDEDYVGDTDADGTLDTEGVGGVYMRDTSNAIDIGWFGNYDRGGQ